MKKAFLVFALLAAFSATTCFGQSSVKPRDLRGTWHLVFDIDKEADSATERVILNAVDGFLDEIDIYMEFQRDQRLKVSVDAFGDEEIEYAKWEINSDGELKLGDTDKFQSDDDTVWLIKGRRLVAFEYNERGKLHQKDSIYLERID